MDTALIVEQPRLEMDDLLRAPVHAPTSTTSPATTVEQSETIESAPEEEPVKGQDIPSTSRVVNFLEEAARIISDMYVDDLMQMEEDSGDSFEVIAGHDDTIKVTFSTSDPVISVTATKSSSSESVHLPEESRPNLTSSPLREKLLDTFDLLHGYGEDDLLNFPDNFVNFVNNGQL